ncbi:MAG: Bax inhibitor-1/YccA family protein [Gemmatimonadetes bacterium]|nr:Bax inhibitor-1/YccA family protein [Gemmatimonadota bacterium]
MSTQEYFGVPINRPQANAIYTDAMSRMYGLVALGVITTGATIWIGDRIGASTVIFSFGWIGWLLMFGVLFLTLNAASAVAARGNTGLGTVLYFAFAGMWGLFLSPILVRYTSDTIGVAFLLTGGLFVAMSAIGMTTKKDLSKLGPMLLYGAIGLIIISIVNVIVLQSSGLFLLINILLLPVFLGLIVWATKEMKELAQEAAMRGDEKAATQVAVMGSIFLYTNVINLFITILSLLGFVSND